MNTLHYAICADISIFESLFSTGHSHVVLQGVTYCGTDPVLKGAAIRMYTLINFAKGSCLSCML